MSPARYCLACRTSRKWSKITLGCDRFRSAHPEKELRLYSPRHKLGKKITDCRKGSCLLPGPLDPFQGDAGAPRSVAPVPPAGAGAGAERAADLADLVARAVEACLSHYLRWARGASCHSTPRNLEHDAHTRQHRPDLPCTFRSNSRHHSRPFPQCPSQRSG